VLPVEQALAQAAQQEGVSVDRAAPPDGAANLFHVPPLPENSARLLRTSSDGVLLESSFSNRDAVEGWGDWSTETKIWVVVGAIVVVGGVGFFILLSSLDFGS